MKTYLRIDADYLEDAKRYTSKAAACRAFLDTARELAEYGQECTASLHFADTKAELVEYPDFIVSLGPRGGLVIEKA